MCILIIEMNVGIYITMNIMAVHITTDVVLCVGLSVLKTTYQFPRLPSYNKNVIFSATNGMSFSKEIHVKSVP